MVFASVILHYSSALVFCGCCNKLPLTWWLKTELYHNSGGQTSKTKVKAGPCSLCKFYGRILPSLFQLPWLVTEVFTPLSSYLYLHKTFFYVSAYSFLSLRKILSLDMRMQYDPISMLTLSTSAKTLFPNKATF